MNYRLYCFDGVGKVWAADWLVASSDAEAIALAHSMDVGVKCEVWQGKHLVATIEPQLNGRNAADEWDSTGFAPG